MQLPKTLSQSSINNFRNCSLRWYYEQIGRPQVYIDTRARDFGIGFHSVISTYYDKISEFPNDREIDEKFNEASTEVGNSETDSQQQKFKKMRNNFISYEKKRVLRKEPKPTFTEKRLTAKLWDDIPEIIGKVDAYYEQLKRITDWKTGGSKDMDEGNYIQGKLYLMLLEKNGYPAENFVFQYLESGVSPQLPRVTEGWLYQQLHSMCTDIENDNFKAKPSGLCNWCSMILSCKNRERCPWSI